MTNNSNFWKIFSTCHHPYKTQSRLSLPFLDTVEVYRHTAAVPKLSPKKDRDQSIQSTYIHHRGAKLARRLEAEGWRREIRTFQRIDRWSGSGTTCENIEAGSCAENFRCRPVTSRWDDDIVLLLRRDCVLSRGYVHVARKNAGVWVLQTLNWFETRLLGISSWMLSLCLGELFDSVNR